MLAQLGPDTSINLRHSAVEIKVQNCLNWCWSRWETEVQGRELIVVQAVRLECELFE